MERLLPESEDLDWVPAGLRGRLRGTQWTLRGALLSAGAGFAGLSWLALGEWIWGMFLFNFSAPLMTNVTNLDERSAVRRSVRRGLAKRASERPLQWLSHSTDDELVRVRGVVRASGAVYQRNRVHWCDQYLVHERGDDFLLEVPSETGTAEPVRVLCDQARLVGSEPRARRIPDESYRAYLRERIGESDHRKLRKLAERSDRQWRPAVRVGSVSVSGGQLVEVIGLKGRQPDPTAQSGGPRHPPLRPVLYGTADTPLMIMPVDKPELKSGPATLQA
jgi:hypothetical protein